MTNDLCFKLAAHPTVLERADGRGELTQIEFVASRGAEVRRWTVCGEHLFDLFAIVEPIEMATEIFYDLTEGKAVQLSGDFSSLQLVLLGFRMVIRKEPTSLQPVKTRYVA